MLETDLTLKQAIIILQEMAVLNSLYENGLPFQKTLIEIPQPTASACKLAGTVEQTGGYNLNIKGKNSILLNQVHNFPFVQVTLQRYKTS